MVQIGYHASHEQFAPSHLLALGQKAELAGFDCIKSSDHFHPWSERQGQSGFAWSWLGAAMQTSMLPFGIISAPGYRYHPAILAQAATTIGEMFPGRLWLALGSGEAINEAITGEIWPEKAERNARLAECVNVIRALMKGEQVTHRGRVTVIEARLYSLPSQPIPMFGAAVTPQTAAFVGAWADGLLTTGNNIAVLRKVIDAFRANGGDSKPVHVQLALSWAQTTDEAYAQALDQWAPAAIGGEVNWDLRRPSDFDMVGRTVGRLEIGQCVLVSADLGPHIERIARIIDLGVGTVHLHCVGRNQERFIERFGEKVLPHFKGGSPP
ncbi:MAG TPA: TIGR03885 family FMN-dependent LLM class oxidoreductase [Devosia sp.]|nr:TIGR03885 family FMN-dependent LLM class oxidoreductase [Devosia sp.]